MKVKTSAAAIDVTFVHVRGQRADVLFIFNKVVESGKTTFVLDVKVTPGSFVVLTGSHCSN